MEECRNVNDLEDIEVRLLFCRAAGLKFDIALRTDLNTYYFFRWRDRRGAWHAAMMTAPELVRHFG